MADVRQARRMRELNTRLSETLAESGAQNLLVPNGSPYHRGKPSVRTNLMVARVVDAVTVPDDDPRGRGTPALGHGQGRQGSTA